MKTRAIPPLEDHQGSVFGETRLLHVTSIIRHGARTPWRGAPKYRCWDSYWTDVETAIWDCKLTTLMAPPLLETIEIEEGKQINDNDDEDRDLAFFLFEKKFDALRYPEAGLTNELNGTCQGKSTNISTAGQPGSIGGQAARCQYQIRAMGWVFLWDKINYSQNPSETNCGLCNGRNYGEDPISFQNKTGEV